VIVQCRKCHKKYDIDKSQLAKGPIRVRCPNCKYVWTIKTEFKKPGAKPEVKEAAIEYHHPEKVETSTFPRLLPIEDLINIRTIVGFLGEKSQFGWWDTNFLSETGLKFLKITFPRTAFSAGVNSVAEAARRLHDNRIGKGRVFHLFRMPESVEQRIHLRLQDFDPSTLLQSFKDKDTALEELQSMTEDSFEASEGPIQVGNGKNMLQLSYIKKVAKLYSNAFENGIQTFPYFSEY